VGIVFFVIAAVLFFLAGVGSTAIPNAATWGLCSTAIGLAVGGWWPRRPAGG
jgi:hypothetical protein